MSQIETHRFGLLDLGFELVSDCVELTDYWRRYTRYFSCEAKPALQYTVTSSMAEQIFEQTDQSPRTLRRTLDFYPILENAFLNDLLGNLSLRCPIYHAAVVAKQGKAIIYLGEPNAGKSTLSVSKVREGWTYLSDEMAAVDGDDVVALPRPISFNDLENPKHLMPIGDERFEEIGYDFVDKSGVIRRSRQFLPISELSAKAGVRFPIDEVVFLDPVEDGPPHERVLDGAEKRARLALSQFPG